MVDSCKKAVDVDFENLITTYNNEISTLEKNKKDYQNDRDKIEALRPQTENGQYSNEFGTNTYETSSSRKAKKDFENRYGQTLTYLNDSIASTDSVLYLRRSDLRNINTAKQDTLEKRLAILNTRYSVENADGLLRQLDALHSIAMSENEENGYRPWDRSTKLIILIICSVLASLLLLAFNKRRCMFYIYAAAGLVVVGLFANALLNALPSYIFSAVGMIMMLFILIDVSPVFYKMMLADGQYEQWHHKEKSVTQDLIRLNFAQSIAQVNNSEVGKLAPMIFSKPWEKIKEILSAARNKQQEELGYGESYYTQEIEEDNKRLFKEVMDMKTAIIRAAYAAWYRDMRDSILGIHKEPTDGDPDIPPSGDGGAPDGDHAETTRGGTSPDYERDPEDNHSGTPEDHFSEYERKVGTTFEEELDSDEDAEEVDTESEETFDSEDSSEDSSSDVDDDNEDSHSDEEDYTEGDESDTDESSEEDDEASEDDSSTEASADETTLNSDNPDSEWEHVVDDESEEDNDHKK